MINAEEVEDLEIDLLLEAIDRAYGYDFRHYARASIIRRLSGFMTNYKITSYLQLTESILHNSVLFEELLKQLSITVSEMFRDPLFYMSLKKNVIPILKSYPFFKIWHAGCATGEEVYSMAILLHECKLLDRATIYATDFNNEALETAKKAIYPANMTKKYIENYNKFGGEAGFSKYYITKYEAIKLHSFLKERVTFANHNLVTDRSFGEMNLILCRNVMIYFDEDLTNHVLTLFKQSLCHKGVLCVGNKESLKFTSVNDQFKALDERMKIYQKR